MYKRGQLVRAAAKQLKNKGFLRQEDLDVIYYNALRDSCADFNLDLLKILKRAVDDELKERGKA